MKIDLHIHTSDWSDGKNTAEEMIEKAIERGLDGIAITDHHRMLKVAEQATLQKKYPNIKIFKGCECSIDGEDINIIGGDGNLKIEKGKYYLNDIIEYVNRTEAFTILNHPFDRKKSINLDLNEFYPDAMDIMSMNIDTNSMDEILRITQKNEMLAIACSDAHIVKDVGLFHIVLDNFVTSDDELVKELKLGKYFIDSFDDLFKARVAEVAEQEKIASEIIAENGTNKDFLNAEGKYGFERFKRGASYMPIKNLLKTKGNEFLNNNKEE